MSYADAGRGRERMAAIGLTGLVQASIGVALLYGLAVHYGPKPPKTSLEGYAVKPVPPPPPVPIPPPPSSAKTAPATETVTTIVTAPIPIVPLANTPVSLPTIPMPPPPVLPATSATPPAPDLTRGAAIRGAIGDWFPKSDYPAAALRAGTEGRVGVTVTVLPSGRAGSCDVTASSGDASLDAATCRLALRNGRFEPARDASGAKTTLRLALPMVRWQIDR